MERKAAIMNKADLYSFTEISKGRLKSYLHHAENLKTDPDKKNRLEKQECIVCFYGSRFGGAAITHQPCMSCQEVQTYCSTSTDILCKPCAKKHKLCRHCGADIELKHRRSNQGDNK